MIDPASRERGLSLREVGIGTYQIHEWYNPIPKVFGVLVLDMERTLPNILA